MFLRGGFPVPQNRKRIAVDGEGEVGGRIGLVVQGKMPPLLGQGLEAVLQHSQSQQWRCGHERVVHPQLSDDANV